MGRKAKYSKEVKIDACIRYLSGRSGIWELKNKIGGDKKSLREWIACYENNVPNAFNEKKYNQTYTEAFKYQIICDVLSVNRSSYYKWKRSSKSKKELQDEELAALILEYHETFDGILGYRRMTTFINKFNEKNYSWKYVRRIMRMLKVKYRIRQKKSNYKKVKPEQVEENILNRQLK